MSKAKSGSVPDKTFQRFKQGVRLHWLGQVGVEPGLQRALHVLVKGVGGQGDDGDAPGVLSVHGADDPRRLQTVHFRHTHVHQDRGVIRLRALPELFHGDSAVFRRIDLHAPALQQQGDDLRVDLHILGQQDASACQLHLMRVL